MNESEFAARRESDWNEMRVLNDRTSITLGTLSDDELKRYLRLYKACSRDLATLHAANSTSALRPLLNEIVSTAHSRLYSAPRSGFVETLKTGMAIAAQTVRRQKAFVLLSIGIVVFSAVLNFGLASSGPGVAEKLGLPAQISDSWKSKGSQTDSLQYFQQKDDTPRGDGGNLAAWAMYAGHNPVVGTITGALGAASFGVYSSIFLYQNGAMIGLLSAEENKVGKLGFLHSWIWPHGIPEISGLIIDGAAGLCLGWALIVPGRRSRSASLREAGKDAAILLVTGVVLTFIAAPIEGFFSFDPGIPQWVKVGVIALEIPLWLGFWLYFGRTDMEKTAAYKRKPQPIPDP